MMYLWRNYEVVASWQKSTGLWGFSNKEWLPWSNSLWDHERWGTYHTSEWGCESDQKLQQPRLSTDSFLRGSKSHLHMEPPKSNIRIQKMRLSLRFASVHMLLLISRVPYRSQTLSFLFQSLSQPETTAKHAPRMTTARHRPAAPKLDYHQNFAHLQS